MNAKLVEEIAAAILYEGYLLYPYRASALKNRQRWNFGVVYPRGYAEKQPAGSADSWIMRSECLLLGMPESILRARVRFLQLSPNRQDASIEREVLVQEVTLADLEAAPLRHSAVERSGVVVELAAVRVMAGVSKLRISISNTATFDAEDREAALPHSLVSTHTILSVDGGEFVSLLDPPEELRASAEACSQSGAWPVLVGEEGDRDAVLCSPIILYDYPKIAPESPGALFDGTEIDEILTLRILTLTDEEKLAMSQTDGRALEILERSRSMPPEQFMKMHGALRGLKRAGQETR